MLFRPTWVCFTGHSFLLVSNFRIKPLIAVNIFIKFTVLTKRYAESELFCHNLQIHRIVPEFLEFSVHSDYRKRVSQEKLLSSGWNLCRNRSGVFWVSSFFAVIFMNVLRCSFFPFYIRYISIYNM